MSILSSNPARAGRDMLGILKSNEARKLIQSLWNFGTCGNYIRLGSGFCIILISRIIADSEKCYLSRSNNLFKSTNLWVSIAGRLGFEPRLMDSESIVLPLDDLPIW